MKTISKQNPPSAKPRSTYPSPEQHLSDLNFLLRLLESEDKETIKNFFYTVGALNSLSGSFRYDDNVLEILCIVLDDYPKLHPYLGARWLGLTSVYEIYSVARIAEFNRG